MVRGSDAGGWHHVEADKLYGRAITLGFSGAPAIADGPGQRLLGMVDVTNKEERRGVLIPVTALMRTWPPLAEPYRGLEAFREEDAPYFFGREEFAKRLWDSFERHPLTLLVDPSGAGKSSLINAGFLPRLRAERCWRVVRFRPGDRPITHLSRELVAALEPGIGALALADETAKRKKALLSEPEQLLTYGEACHQTTDCALCIVVDQFEETFSLARPAHPDQHRALLAALASLAGQRDSAPVKVVLGLRSDFQSLLQSDEDAAAIVDVMNGGALVVLRAMLPSEREHAILRALDAAHLHVALEDGLLGQIMEEVANNPDALPLLEFALTELWRRIEIDSAGRRLSRAAHDEIGGVTGALARRADHILNELKPDERQVRRLFMELVRVADTPDQDARRPRSKAELDALDPTFWTLAQRLAEKRLLATTAEATTAEPVVDVVHEALFRRWSRLRAWIGEERDFLRWRQRLDERWRKWDTAGQDSRELLNSRALEEAERWLEQRADALSEQQLRFIQASRDAADVQAVQEHADRIWNRLEFNWRYGEIGEDEFEALLELQRAPLAVRHEFLFAAMTDEPRARRLCRASGVAFRAAFALDLEQAAASAGKLSAWLVRQEPLGSARAQVALLMAYEFFRFEANLAPSALVFATAAIAGTTDKDQLRACAQAIQAMAGLADAATARQVVNQATTAIAKTTDVNQLRAYAQTIQALTGLADVTIARIAATLIVERTASDWAKTTNPDQLWDYAQTIQALAGLADVATVRSAATGIVEHVAASLKTIEGTLLHSNTRVIRLLASLADAAIVQQVIDEAVSAAFGTTDFIKSVFSRGMVQDLAGFANAAIAGKVIEGAATAITKPAGAERLRRYAELIQAVAGLADVATARTAATAIVEHLAATITKTRTAFQLREHAQMIQALAGLADAAAARIAATVIVEQAVARIAKIADQDHQLNDYIGTIRALAGLADAAAARIAATLIVGQAVARIAKITDQDQLQDYIRTIQALAGSIDAATARQVIKDAVAAIPETTDWSRLRAYAQTIQALASLADGATARTAAAVVIKQSMILLDRSRDTSELDLLADIMLTTRREVPGAAWTLAAVELLKCPLCGSSKRLEEVIAEECGMPEMASRSLWDLVSWLEAHEPWLPLRTPFRPVEAILTDFAHLLEHDPPLPDS